MIIIYLTCANKEEAVKISQALLDAHLIACARRTNINTMNWWQGAQEGSNEVLLMMDTHEDKFDAIEKLVVKLHSYDLPSLVAVPVVKTNKGLQAWLDESLQAQ